GFAKGKGVDVKALEVREMDGGKYVVAVVKQAGRPAPDVLAESLPELVAGIKFDKSMRWNASNVAFSRPIRWLVALLGDQVIPFEYAGVTSGNVTRGLRPYDSPEIEIKSADKYFDVIKNAGIVLDTEERKASILEQVKQAAALVGGEAIIDDGLLAEVTNLVEKPTAVIGAFNEEFLSLPRDVLISTMKKHQRYFPVQRVGATFTVAQNNEKGRRQASPLLPHFIAIRNGDDLHIDLVRQGNEHVLHARFADADFFVREDLKHKLEDFRPRLGTLTFQAKLGSMLDKSERMLKLATGLGEMLGLDNLQLANLQRATFLAKADLMTKMVVEMTSLQGLMGREYALRSGENQAVAEAIGEQYQPVPKTKPGLAVALADRLDSLAGLFAAGLAPSGTKDPFGLRRAALGVVQPLIEHDIAFDLRAALKEAAALEPVEVSGVVQSQVLEFISGRLRALLIDAGYKYDVVDAILAAQGHDPARASRAVRQLSAWVSRDDWHTILPAYARCVRITRDQKEKFAVKPEAFVEQAEKDLFAAVKRQKAISTGDVDAFLSVVVDIIPSINIFFDKVLVMAEEKAIRENRLGLLQQIAAF
ncbi:MAG: glycine--tRNA ligase subunit beta, partial [Anaerolineales bacterium]|nr:glycine--tRNA ligase subunit beta [Anaerolineales bacterium]